MGTVIRKFKSHIYVTKYRLFFCTIYFIRWSDCSTLRCTNASWYLQQRIIKYFNCICHSKDIWVFIAILIRLILFSFFFTNPESSRKLALRGVRMYELIKTGYGNFLFKCDITLGEDTSGCTNGSLVVLIRVRVSLGAIFHYNLHLWILLFRGIIIVESRARNVFVSIFFFFESSRIDLGPKSLRFRVFLTFMFPFISNIISLLF